MTYNLDLESITPESVLFAIADCMEKGNARAFHSAITEAVGFPIPHLTLARQVENIVQNTLIPDGMVIKTYRNVANPNGIKPRANASYRLSDQGKELFIELRKQFEARK